MTSRSRVSGGLPDDTSKRLSRMTAASCHRTRRASPADAAGIARVYVSNAQHHVRLAPDAYRVPDLRAVEARYRELIDNDGWAVFVVDDADGRIVASAEGQVGPPTPPHSMLRPRRVAHVGVAVLPERRGGGLGGDLVLMIERWASQQQVDAILLDMLTANTHARRFYERLGYTEFGTLMRKVIR